jgi:hypothetical protein
VLARQRHLLHLLDLTLQEPDRLRRLQKRLEAERRPRAGRTFRTLRQLGPLAALLLLALGLGLSLGPGGAMPEAYLGVRALAEAGGAKPLRITRGNELEANFPADVRSKRLAQEGRLPPPEVGIGLEVRNQGAQPLLLDLTNQRAELLIHVQGPAGALIEAPYSEPAAVLTTPPLTLGPGQEHVFRIDRLVMGTRARPRALYWTGPGEYTLTIHLRAATTGGRLLWIDSAPIRVKVSPSGAVSILGG